MSSDPIQNFAETESRSRFSAIVRHLIRQPAFVAAAVVLLVAAIGLNLSVEYLQLHFKKDAVPLRIHPAYQGPSLTGLGDNPFLSMPTVCGRWMCLMKDEPLAEDVQDTLGTEVYLFREYLNPAELQKTSSELRAEFEPLSMIERKEKIARFRRQQPKGVVTVALTYYTGKADTVAHIPERCYLADGYDQVKRSTENWSAGSGTVPVRFITFENLAEREAQRVNVAYFFQVNGKYTAESLEVRRSLQDLFARYGYYLKVEMMSTIADRDLAGKAMSECLAAVLPEAEKVFPDWSQYASK